MPVAMSLLFRQISCGTVIQPSVRSSSENCHRRPSVRIGREGVYAVVNLHRHGNPGLDNRCDRIQLGI